MYFIVHGMRVHRSAGASAATSLGALPLSVLQPSVLQPSVLQPSVAGTAIASGAPLPGGLQRVAVFYSVLQCGEAKCVDVCIIRAVYMVRRGGECSNCFRRSSAKCVAVRCSQCIVVGCVAVCIILYAPCIYCGGGECSDCF